MIMHKETETEKERETDRQFSVGWALTFAMIWNIRDVIFLAFLRYTKS